MARDISTIENDIDNSAKLEILEMLKDYVISKLNTNFENIDKSIGALKSTIEGTPVITSKFGAPLAPAATDPSSAPEYSWYFNTTSHEFKIYHGGTWHEFGTLNANVNFSENSDKLIGNDATATDDAQIGKDYKGNSKYSFGSTKKVSFGGGSKVDGAEVSLGEGSKKVVVGKGADNVEVYLPADTATDNVAIKKGTGGKPALFINGVEKRSIEDVANNSLNYGTADEVSQLAGGGTVTGADTKVLSLEGASTIVKVQKELEHEKLIPFADKAYYVDDTTVRYIGDGDTFYSVEVPITTTNTSAEYGATIHPFARINSDQSYFTIKTKYENASVEYLIKESSLNVGLRFVMPAIDDSYTWRTIHKIENGLPVNYVRISKTGGTTVYMNEDLSNTGGWTQITLADDNAYHDIKASKLMENFNTGATVRFTFQTKPTNGSPIFENSYYSDSYFMSVRYEKILRKLEEDTQNNSTEITKIKNNADSFTDALKTKYDGYEATINGKVSSDSHRIGQSSSNAETLVFRKTGDYKGQSYSYAGGAYVGAFNGETKYATVKMDGDTPKLFGHDASTAYDIPFSNIQTKLTDQEKLDISKQSFTDALKTKYDGYEATINGKADTSYVDTELGKKQPKLLTTQQAVVDANAFTNDYKNKVDNTETKATTLEATIATLAKKDLSNVVEADIVSALQRAGVQTSLFGDFKGFLAAAPDSPKELDWYVNTGSHAIQVWHDSQWNDLGGAASTLDKSTILSNLGLTESQLTAAKNLPDNTVTSLAGKQDTIEDKRLLSADSLWDVANNRYTTIFKKANDMFTQAHSYDNTTGKAAYLSANNGGDKFASLKIEGDTPKLYGHDGTTAYDIPFANIQTKLTDNEKMSIAKLHFTDALKTKYDGYEATINDKADTTYVNTELGKKQAKLLADQLAVVNAQPFTQTEKTKLSNIPNDLSSITGDVDITNIEGAILSSLSGPEIEHLIPKGKIYGRIKFYNIGAEKVIVGDTFVNVDLTKKSQWEDLLNVSGGTYNNLNFIIQGYHDADGGISKFKVKLNTLNSDTSQFNFTKTKIGISAVAVPSVDWVKLTEKDGKSDILNLLSLTQEQLNILKTTKEFTNAEKTKYDGYATGKQDTLTATTKDALVLNAIKAWVNQANSDGGYHGLEVADPSKVKAGLAKLVKLQDILLRIPNNVNASLDQRALKDLSNVVISGNVDKILKVNSNGHIGYADLPAAVDITGKANKNLDNVSNTDFVNKIKAAGVGTGTSSTSIAKTIRTYTSGKVSDYIGDIISTIEHGGNSIFYRDIFDASHFGEKVGTPFAAMGSIEDHNADAMANNLKSRKIIKSISLSDGKNLLIGVGYSNYGCYLQKINADGTKDGDEITILKARLSDTSTATAGRVIDILQISSDKIAVFYNMLSSSGVGGTDFSSIEIFNLDGTPITTSRIDTFKCDNNEELIPKMTLLGTDKFMVWGSATSTVNTKIQKFNIDGTKDGAEVDTGIGGDIIKLSNGKFLVVDQLKVQFLNEDLTKLGSSMKFFDLSNDSNPLTYITGAIETANGKIIVYGSESQAGLSSDAGYQILNIDGTKSGDPVQFSATHSIEYVTPIGNDKFMVFSSKGGLEELLPLDPDPDTEEDDPSSQSITDSLNSLASSLGPTKKEVSKCQIVNFDFSKVGNEIDVPQGVYKTIDYGDNVIVLSIDSVMGSALTSATTKMQIVSKTGVKHGGEIDLSIKKVNGYIDLPGNKILFYGNYKLASGGTDSNGLIVLNQEKNGGVNAQIVKGGTLQRNIEQIMTADNSTGKIFVISNSGTITDIANEILDSTHTLKTNNFN